MLKSCPYCGRIHNSAFDCGRRPKKIAFRYDSESGRYTRAWRKTANHVKDECHYFCEYCLSQGEYTRGDLSVHHIIKLRDRPDLLLEPTNLICLCGRCHALADDGKINPVHLRTLAERRISGRLSFVDIPPGGDKAFQDEETATDAPPS